MAGVYNRKLFRQSSARDELRKLGGIMSSSEELMREALRTAMQAPGPEARGPMAMPQRPPMGAGMPAPMPMMQQGIAGQMPMMQQPMAPMPMQLMPMMQPMMAPQPMAQAPFMPPTMPQSVQPRGFDDGGLITLPPAPDRSGLGGVAKPRPMPRSSVPSVPDLTAEIDLNPAPPAVDITKPAGTVVQPSAAGVTAPSFDALVEKMQTIAEKIDVTPPEQTASELVDTVVEEPTGDLQFDLAKTLEEMTGDSSAYEKNIDELNRGIIGAAIAAGTSARATENIAKGLLVGMEGAKATEERRAGDARALQLKALEVRAAEQAAREAESKATTKAQAEAEAKLIEDMRDTYDTVYRTVFEGGVFAVPEGAGELNDYATKVARDKVVELFGEENAAKLLGSSPEAGGPAPAATTRTGTPPTFEQYKASVMAKNPDVTLTDEELQTRYKSWVSRNYTGN